MKHTPGPWRVGTLSGEVMTARGVAVASPPDGIEDGQWTADAKLIAAAPELLAALQAMVEFYAPDCDGDCHVVEHGPAGAARRVIAKAKEAA